MQRWGKVIGRALAIAVAWSVAWAAVGALTGVLVDPAGRLDALWIGPAVGLHPGFVGGIVFAALLAIMSPDRALAERPLAQVIAAGGMAGLLLGFLPLAINQPPSGAPLWQVAATVIGSLTFLSVFTAIASLAVARSVRRRA